MTTQIILPPSVYSETHSDRMSEKYTHIKTNDVLTVFQDHGWEVSSASAAKKGKVEHSRHLIRMRHRDYLDGFGADKIHPELIVLNSHNGSWALRMMMGVFRTVCANGMVAGTVWDGITLKHYNLRNVEEKVELATTQMNDNVLRLEQTVKLWDDTDLTLAQMQALEARAMEIRWGHLSATPVTQGTLLHALREDDTGTSLWKVFNRVQENMTQGGYMGNSSNGRSLSIKRVTNVKRDYKFNRQIWDAANDLYQSIAA
jgi:hypothetical protein